MTTSIGRTCSSLLLVGEEYVSAELQLSDTLALPLAANCAEYTYLTHTDLQTHNSPKMTLKYFNALSRKRDYFYWYRKIFPLRIVIKPQNKVCVKKHPYLFSSVLDSFAVSHKQKKSSEWSKKKKKESDTKLTTVTVTLSAPSYSGCICLFICPRLSSA